MADRTKPPTVRLIDVAKRAGCSAATVSRVLNSPDTVNRDARLRVEEAVRELGYTRNGAARALRSRRSQIVGIILPTLKQPIYAGFIDALQDTLATQAHSLIVTTSEYSLDRELFQARRLVERGIDGLVLIGRAHLPELYALMQAQELPYVASYTFSSAFAHPVIGFDNVAAMAQVVDHLHALGHRHFALLAGQSDQNDRVQERIKGAVAALASRGLALSRERIAEEALTIEGGRLGLRRLISTVPRPTALMCTGDILAYGALAECRARNIDVPSDLSVVGFDSLQASAHVFPALTSVAAPAETMGRGAGAYLLARLAGRNVPAQVALDTRLVVRDTTAPPAGGASG